MQNPLYKKAYFQCARRAMLENELIMRRFAEEVVQHSYNDEKLTRLNKLLTEMYDNDMYDLIVGSKTPDDFKGRYDNEICIDMKMFADSIKRSGQGI